MKKILTILMLVMLVSAAQAQQQHEKIKELKELLNRHGLELRFKSRHNSVENVVIRKDLGIGYGLWAPRTDSTMTLEEKQRRIHQFDSLNNQRRIEMAAMLDSMKPIVAEMMASASECYLHENHKDGKDTLEYFFCFPHKDSDSMLLAHPNHRPFAAERVQLHFRQGLKQGPYNNWLFESNLYLTYNYYESTQGEMTLLNRNGASWSVKKPHRFDVDGFERFLSQALHPILKKRGVHQYPIHWQFDDTYLTRDFKYDKKEAFLLYDIQKNEGARITARPYKGLVTGSYYFIPKVCVDSTATLLRHIEALVTGYMDQHPEQPFDYMIRHDYNGMNFYNPHPFVRARDILTDDHLGYDLYAYVDETGIYLLSMKHDAWDFWIPKGFEKMKRWVNGKATYRK